MDRTEMWPALAFVCGVTLCVIWAYTVDDSALQRWACAGTLLVTGGITTQISRRRLLGFRDLLRQAILCELTGEYGEAKAHAIWARLFGSRLFYVSATVGLWACVGAGTVLLLHCVSSDNVLLAWAGGGYAVSSLAWFLPPCAASELIQ